MQPRCASGRGGDLSSPLVHSSNRVTAVRLLRNAQQPSVMSPCLASPGVSSRVFTARLWVPGAWLEGVEGPALWQEAWDLWMRHSWVSHLGPLCRASLGPSQPLAPRTSLLCLPLSLSPCLHPGAHRRQARQRTCGQRVPGALISHPGRTAEDTASRRPDGACLRLAGDQAWASRWAGGRSGVVCWVCSPCFRACSLRALSFPLHSWCLICQALLSAK